MQMRVSSVQGAFDPTCRLGSQRDRPLQERRGRCHACPGPSPCRGPFQLGRDSLVRSRRSRSAVPDPAVRVRIGVDDLRESAMGGPAVLRRTRCVGGRPHQRMAETHPRSDLEELLGAGRLGRVVTDTEDLGGAPQQGRVTSRVGGGEQQQALGRSGSARTRCR